MRAPSCLECVGDARGPAPVGYVDAPSEGLLTKKSPSTRVSIRVRKKQATASSGVHTMGSFSLNDVLRSTGTPDIFANWLIRFQ